jgi:hypothetical protein
MMGWAGEKALACKGCGQPVDESMADENKGPVPDYHATALRCRACHSREAKAAEIAGRDDKDPTAGMYFGVTKNGVS